jgi:hypothetical protein
LSVLSEKRDPPSAPEGSATHMLRILIVEDSILTARVLHDMVDAQPDMTVVGMASTGQDGVRRAIELQPEYAPELALVGVVGGGVPGDLVQVALQLEGKAGFGLLAYSLLGLENAYPELDFSGTLNDRGRAMHEAMIRNDCTLELLLDYQGMRIQDISDRSPLVDPEWLARLAENKLGTTPIEVPVLQYHATQDELVAFPQARALRQSYCEQGVDVTWLTQERGHIGMVYHGNSDAMEFIAGRLAGEAPSSNC